MKKPVIFAISGYVLFLFLFLIAYYLLNYPEKLICERIINSNGYTLQREEEPVTLKFFIKPEWIEQNDKEVKKLSIELFGKHDTKIELDYIMNRPNDLYFNFHPENKLRESGGEFLTNEILHGDGRITTIMRDDEIVLYDIDRNQIPIGQRGQGPEADFSFGIEHVNWDAIKNGFYVEYSGYYLYKYVRN